MGPPVDSEDDTKAEDDLRGLPKVEDSLLREVFHSVGGSSNRDCTWRKLGDGKGFLGTVYSLRATVTERINSCDEEEQRNICVAVKTLPDADSPLKDFVISHHLLDVEAAAYELLSTCVDAHECPRIPTFYTRLHTPPCLVMEDLSAVSVSLGLSDALSFEQAAAVMRELAKLHAIRLEDVAMKRRDLVDVLLRSGNFTDGGKVEDGSVLQRIYRQILPEMEEVVVAEVGLEGVERLRELRGKIDPMLEGLAEGRGMRMSHGDCWAGNMLFDAQDERELLALLDFQFTSFTRTPFLDVIMVLSASCDADLRRERRSELFDVYVQSLPVIEHVEQDRLLRDLERVHLPLGVAFVCGFGRSTAAPDGRLIERFCLLLHDYCELCAGCK